MKLEERFLIFHRYAGEMFKLVEPAFSQRINFKENDHFGFMSACFVNKQIEHARSLGILVDSGQYKDAEIISRVMLEGLIFILWARIDIDDRAFAWRSYSLVSDLDTMMKMKEKGEVVDQNQELELRNLLEQNANRFLTRKARLDPTAYNNPYVRYWNVDKFGKKVELSQMAEELQDKSLKTLYDDLSQYSHWTPRGVGSSINKTKSGISMSFDSVYSAITACAVCIQSLGGTAKAASEHFGLGIHEDLDILFEKYIDEVGSLSGKSD